MNLRNKSLLRALSMGMAVILLVACLPCAALADSFSAAVNTDAMYVAADPFGTSTIGVLPRNTIVTVHAVENDVALISYRNNYGYARVADMVSVDSIAQKAVAQINTYVFQQPNVNSARIAIPAGMEMYLLATKGNIAMVEKNGVIAYANLQHLIVNGQPMGDVQQTPDASQSAPAQQMTPVYALVDTYVFQRPDLNSAYVRISAGFAMNLVAVNGNIAMVEKNGVIGYTNLQHLITADQAASGGAQQPSQSGTLLPSISEAFQSGKYSNEQLCYLFLIQVMGYNTAAAAGVLANINYESGFKTAIDGDGGTSYGLCQWHASRKTRLLEFCASYGVAADSLVAQLAYLKYELENYYTLVHHYLQGVENTEDGAYDAGYFFCWNFENPANREAQSIKRGQSARSTYYGRYANL